MGKTIYIDEIAEKDLNKLPEQIESKFREYLDLLEMAGKLTFPEARKITRDIFEIRIQHQGSYRAFYAYVGEDFIVLLHLYTKKTQKSPLRHIKTAEQRLKKYK
jgi:phage-related protein